MKEKNNEGIALELIKIWKLDTLKFIHEEVLDLEDNPNLKEDPSKLIFISESGSYLFMRSDDKKGVKILFLEDGTKVDQTSLIHKGSIFQIVVLRERYIITSSRDKKVKVYDWYENKVLTTLSSHIGPV